MSGKKAISVESGGNALLLPISVSVLLVDGDSTCLAILSKMLHWFGYKGKCSDFLVFLFVSISDQNLNILGIYLLSFYHFSSFLLFDVLKV